MHDFTTWIEMHRVGLSPALTWDRVIGHEEAKQQLRGVISTLLDPDALARVGASPPRGLLLHGEPGTGKTLTARTFAAELDRAAQALERPPVPFYEVPASSLSAERLAELARWSASLTHPAILYIDEIELWGADRNSGLHDPETRASLFAALSALDGLADTSRLVWLASANKHPAHLDEALCRPGRLGYHIGLSGPTRGDIARLLEAEFSRRLVLEDVPMDQATALLSGQTQAAVVQALDDGALLSVGAGEQGLTAATRHDRRATANGGRRSMGDRRPRGSARGGWCRRLRAPQRCRLFHHRGLGIPRDDSLGVGEDGQSHHFLPDSTR